METIEKIEVRIKTEKGKTVCICLAEKSRCPRRCEIENVYRDKFEDWIDTFHRDIYGR